MNWNQFLFGNAWRTLGILAALLIFGPAIVGTLSVVLTDAVNQLFPILAVLAFGIYAFRRLTGFTGGRRR